MMLPTPLPTASATNGEIHHLGRILRNHCNTPEEDDETMSERECDGGTVSKPASCHGPPDGRRTPPNHHRHHTLCAEDSLCCREGPGGDRKTMHGLPPFQSEPNYGFFPPSHSFPDGFGQPTPFPSQAAGSWLHPSFASSWSGAGYPSSLPSCLTAKDYPSHPGESCYSGNKFSSLPGRYSPSVSSLEQPYSLHTNPPSVDMYHHTMSPYYCLPQGTPCCAQCPQEAHQRGPMAHQRGPMAHQIPRPGLHPLYRLHCPTEGRPPGAGSLHNCPNDPATQKNPPHGALSLEQRKVFVTYEADNDKHINEIINFVALLRHNGFDTHIDMFEQQFRSISKIDFMERYLSEKEYLIIIIISPKYFETVVASPASLESDERTLNTVYIHKQLQNEFIQNGSKNFRFIPILFPGARKSHVPNWLQNTHVYSWPRDRDDILRRLMRVEKYNPPPIGELPTIVSIPI